MKVLLLFILLVQLVLSAPVVQETHQVKHTVVNIEDVDTAIRLLAREIEETSTKLVGSQKVINSPKTFKAVASSLEKVSDSDKYQMSLEVETIGVVQSDDEKNNPVVQDTDFLQLASMTLENAKTILAAQRAGSIKTYAIVSPNIEKVPGETQIKHRMSFEIEPVITTSTSRRKRLADTKNNKTNNIIKQVIKALEGREDMVYTIEYLEKSVDDEDLLRQLPLVSADGKVNQYTFFAPTSWGIHRSIPQDIANPYSYDQKLRHDVFLRHFVRRLLSKADLEKDGLAELTMADNALFNITRSEEGERGIGNMEGVWASITNENIDIRVDSDGTNGRDTIRIFVVDGVFVKQDEVYEAISRNPHPWVSPFGNTPIIEPPTVLPQP